MPVAIQRREATRQRIILGAGRLFRRRGYEAVSIDDIMAEADLTRGSFYAYFRSKAELFNAVVSEDQTLLGRVQRAAGASTSERRDRLLEVFESYLSAKRFPHNGTHCSLAALACDAPRIEGASTELFSAKVELLAKAIGDAAPGGGGEARGYAIAAQVIGASILARACGEDRVAQQVLESALTEISRILK